MSDHEKEHEGEKGHSGGHGGGGHGHGGGHEEHEGVPEWMISFADNTALMMGLFVILLAMNMGPKAKSVMGGEPSDKASSEAASTDNMLDLVISVREAFNNPVDTRSTNPKEAALRRRIAERQGSTSTRVTPDQSAREGGAVRESEYNEVGARIDFEDGSSLLTGAARQRIADTARQFGATRYVVEIRGHASPFETFMDAEKGMKLAHERAMAVARELAAQGVRWGQVRVVACGDNERLVARTYNRAEDSTNQRAEIILTKDLVPGDSGVERPKE